MEEIFNLEISENTIKSMIELNKEIVDLSKKEIKEKLDLLESIGCSKSQIVNIVSSNSLYLSKTNEEINKLVNYLKQTGFNTLNILFDSNPYILNLEPFEIKKYIDKRISKGEDILDIIDDIDSNPSLLLEI